MFIQYVKVFFFNECSLLFSSSYDLSFFLYQKLDEYRTCDFSVPPTSLPLSQAC